MGGEKKYINIFGSFTEPLNYIKGFRTVATKSDRSLTRIKTYIPPLSIMHANVTKRWIPQQLHDCTIMSYRATKKV